MLIYDSSHVAPFKEALKKTIDWYLLARKTGSKTVEIR